MVVLTQKKRKKKYRKDKSIDAMMIGGEPFLEVVDDSKDAAYAKAIGWYSYMYTAKDGRGWLEQWVKANRPEDFKTLRSLKDYNIVATACWIAKMALNGSTLGGSPLEYLNSKIDQMVSKTDDKFGDLPDEEEKPAAPAQVRLSPAERVARKNAEILCAVEEEIDKFCEAGFKSEFSVYDYLQSTGHNPNIVKRLTEYFKLLFDEVTEYPDDFMDGGKRRYAALLNFYSKQYQDMLRLRQNRMVVRKARKPKAVNVDKQIAGVQYATRYDPLKLVSVHPKDLLKAKEVWIYDTHYRSFSYFKAPEGQTMSVKGTTLQNFSEESQVKRLRKPEEFFEKFFAKTIVGQRKALDEVKAKAYPAKGRLNKNSIIVKVN